MLKSLHNSRGVFFSFLVALLNYYSKNLNNRTIIINILCLSHKGWTHLWNKKNTSAADVFIPISECDNFLIADIFHVFNKTQLAALNRQIYWMPINHIKFSLKMDQKCHLCEFFRCWFMRLRGQKLAELRCAVVVMMPN